MLYGGKQLRVNHIKMWKESLVKEFHSMINSISKKKQGRAIY